MRGDARPVVVVRPDQLDVDDVVRVNGEWVRVVGVDDGRLAVQRYGVLRFSELSAFVEVLG